MKTPTVISAINIHADRDRDVEVLLVSIPDTESEQSEYFSVSVARTSKVVRKFFASLGRDAFTSSQGVYSNVVSRSDSGDAWFAFPDTVMLSGSVSGTKQAEGIDVRIVSEATLRL